MPVADCCVRVLARCELVASDKVRQLQVETLRRTSNMPFEQASQGDGTSLGLCPFTVARLLQVETDPGEKATAEQHDHDGAKAQCPLRRHSTSLEINLFILLQRV